MSNPLEMPERLFQARSRYVERFGSVHPILADLSPEILLPVLEMALQSQSEIDAVSVERALQTVNSRIDFIANRVRV